MNSQHQDISSDAIGGITVESDDLSCHRIIDYFHALMARKRREGQMPELGCIGPACLRLRFTNGVAPRDYWCG